MSTSITLVAPDDNKQWSVTRPSAAILQSILDDTCTHFTLDPLTHRLEQRDIRGNARPVDHTLSIRMAQLPANSRLHIAHCPTLSPNIHLTIALPGQQPAAVNGVFPVTSTLQSVLSHFHSLHPDLQLSSYAGVPPPEHNERFSLHINVTGTMQAVVDTGCKRVVGDAAMAATTLASLGFKGEEGGRAGKGRLKLRHEYEQPAMSEAKQAEVMQKFSTTLQQSVDEIDQKRRDKAAEKQREQEEEASAVLPNNRQLRVLRAQPGFLPAPELPDSFYEVTEDDSVEYARSVMRQAAKERGEAAPSPAAGSSQRRRPVLALVRVKLPSHVYVEGVFKAGERVADVREWLLRCVRDDVRANVGTLFVAPPKRTLDTRKTLREEGLLGSVMMHATINGRHDTQRVRRGRENARVDDSKEERKEESKDEKEEVKQQPQQATSAARVAVEEAKHAEWLPEDFLSDVALSAMQTITPPKQHVDNRNESASDAPAETATPQQGTSQA